MTKFQKHNSTRFTFEGKEYAADLGRRENGVTYTDTSGKWNKFFACSSFRVYDEEDVEYIGLWTTEDLSPRKEEEIPEPVMVVRVWKSNLMKEK